MGKYLIKTFYFFKALPNEELEAIKKTLKNWAQEYKINGLIIIGTEGLNTTLSSSHHENLNRFVKASSFLKLASCLTSSSTLPIYFFAAAI